MRVIRHYLVKIHHLHSLVRTYPLLTVSGVFNQTAGKTWEISYPKGVWSKKRHHVLLLWFAASLGVVVRLRKWRESTRGWTMWWMKGGSLPFLPASLPFLPLTPSLPPPPPSSSFQTLEAQLPKPRSPLPLLHPLSSFTTLPGSLCKQYNNNNNNNNPALTGQSEGFMYLVTVMKTYWLESIL